MSDARTTKPQRFSLAQLDLSQVSRFAGWQTALSTTFDILAQPDEIGRFEGDFCAHASDRFVLSETTSSRVCLMRSPDTIARSRLDHFAIRLVVAGSAAGTAGPRPVDAGEGDVLFLDMLEPLTLQLCVRGDVSADAMLWVPRTRLLASFSDEQALHGMVLKGTSAAGAVIGAALRALAGQAGRMTIRDFDALADGMVELTAKAVGPMLADMAVSGAPVPLASFVTVRRFVDRHLNAPDLGPDMIARSFGLSRASLYRLFEPAGGIASYIRKARLNRAYQEITAADLADRRIGQIAYQLGFKNISSFDRLFRTTFGLSPSQARAAALQGISGPLLRAHPQGDPVLANWLRDVGKR